MTAAFDGVIHGPHRFQICCLLAGVEEMDFSTVRELVDVSESVLSKQVKLLEDAGYVTVAKRTLQSRLRTWLGLTAAGRSALGAHLDALRAVMATAEAPLRG